MKIRAAFVLSLVLTYASVFSAPLYAEERGNPCEQMKTHHSRALEDACALQIVENAVVKNQPAKPTSPVESSMEEPALISKPSIECNSVFDGTRAVLPEHRTQYVLSGLLERAKMNGRVLLCVWETGETGPEPGLVVMVVHYKDEWAIGATSYVFNYFSDLELNGAMAHEVGHILLGHRSPGKDTQEERQEADAVAIKLVGENVLRAGLKKCGLKDRNIDERLSRAKQALGKVPDF